MPHGKHQMKLDIPIDQVWSFISDMNNWAPLVPGYMEHNILNDKQSTWKFQGDLGFVKKTINLKINITRWQEPTKITFNLMGVDTNFKGDGYFEATSVSKQLTKVTGFLNITAKGLKGPMMNTVLKSFVPNTTKQLTEAIAQKMGQMETVSY